MLTPFRQHQRSIPAKGLVSGIEPVSVDWQAGGQPAAITFDDESTAIGSCIRCISPPCREYQATELQVSSLPSFPADVINLVCPTGAIQWLEDASAPHVIADLCISCGLCVGRCPVNAIHLSANGAVVNDLPNSHFELLAELRSAEQIAGIIARFTSVEQEGIYQSEEGQVLGQVFDQISRLKNSSGAKFDNILARNLLIHLGAPAAMRRQGDQSLRMDILFDLPGLLMGTSEVELGGDVLEANRNIVDDVAVLASRYHIPLQNIVPLVLCLNLPPSRAEYWRVVQDVQRVLGVTINTATVGMLILLVWNRAKLLLGTEVDFYADDSDQRLQTKTEAVLGRILNPSTSYPGLFRP